MELARPEREYFYWIPWKINIEIVDFDIMIFFIVVFFFENNFSTPHCNKGRSKLTFWVWFVKTSRPEYTYMYLHKFRDIVTIILFAF